MTDIRGLRAPLIFGPIHAPGDGISSYSRQVVIVTDDGQGRTAPIGEMPAVRLVTRPAGFFRNTQAWHHFEPVAPRPEGRVGYSFGGAYVLVDVEAAEALRIPPAAYTLHDRAERWVERPADTVPLD